MTKFWGYSNDGISNLMGPFATLNEAIQAALAVYPNNSRDVMTGHGADGPYFDLRWHKRETWAAILK
jgi:hypothetical protein